MAALSKEALDVLLVARTVVDRRWSSDRFGEWDQRFGRRRVFCLTGALIAVTDLLSLQDSVRCEVMEQMEARTVEKRTVPKTGGGTEVKDLAWWSDVSGREAVLALIDDVVRANT
jgi:hypothetical protein